MKLLITVRNIILEELHSVIHDWKTNLNFHGNYYSTAIYYDDESGDILYLNVGFTDNPPLEDYQEYSYSYILYDSNQKPKTDFIIDSREILNYINIDDKQKIFMIIMDLTRQVLGDVLPDKILRRTTVAPNEKSIVKYNKITEIMVNEYDYEIVSEVKDKSGNMTWLLHRKDITDMNNDMNEEYFIRAIPSKQDVVNEMYKDFKPPDKLYVNGKIIDLKNRLKNP